MKNLILSLSGIIIMGGILISCQSQNEKEKKAIEKVQDAKNNLINVQQDTDTAYEKFILESEEQIKIYEKNIADLKIKLRQEKKEKTTSFQNKLADLEQRNEVLKTKIANYKKEHLDNWDEIQIEFKKDLDELGSSIAGFFNQE